MNTSLLSDLIQYALFALGAALVIVLAYEPLAAMYRDYIRRVDALITSLGIEKKPSAVFLEQVVIGLSFSAVGLVIDPKGFGFAVILFPIGLMIPFLALKAQQSTRLKLLNMQYIDTLTVLSTCIRAGLNLPQAIEVVAKRSASPTREEFQVLTNELNLGMPVERGVQRMAARLGIPNFDAFANAIVVTRLGGGDLAQIFDRLAESSRESGRLEGMIESMTAQGRMQGNLLASLPLVLGGAMYLMEPGMILPLFTEVPGYFVLAGIAFCELMGLYMIRRIMRVTI